jgi:16S rRNA (uracil1498-N3)-methyltransferase
VPHVYVADLDVPALDEIDRHHLERVRRLRAGDELTASDGYGRWRLSRLGAGGRLEPMGEIVEEPASVPAITVAFALTKGERPELVVQKLTELGVDRIVPFTAARSVARWDRERAARHVERLRIVAREAGMQSGRARLPEVTEVAGFTEAAGLPGATLATRGGAAPTLARPTILVGPEGGWADAELDSRLPHTGLGPHVLRAETAAIAGASALVMLRSGLLVSPGTTD